MSTMLPQGYPSEPSDQQILQCLCDKVTGKQSSIELPYITKQDPYATEPSDLFANFPPEQKFVYCFPELKKKGNRQFHRKVRIGTNNVGKWSEQQYNDIHDSDQRHIGSKKLRTFKRNGKSTGFSMREYHLAGEYSQVNAEYYVACRIERNIKRGGLETHQPLRTEGLMGVNTLDPATQFALQQIETHLMGDDSQEDALTLPISDEELRAFWLDQT